MKWIAQYALMDGFDRRQFLKTSGLMAAGCCLGIPANGLFASTYIVQPGDTLSHIAQRNGVGVDALMRENQLQSDRILAGQVLRIPGQSPSAVHTVRPGDTLGRIASRHGTTVARLRADNNLTGDRIYPGQQLVIRSSSGPPASRHLLGEVISVTRGLRVNRSRWRFIVGHHAGVNQGNARIYDRFHRRQMRMPNGLAYHFVIGNGSDSGDGQIEIGNRWLEQLQGGHVRSPQVNETGIGICLVGNFEERRPTSRQLSAFTELVAYLRNDLLGGNCRFAVHREIDGARTLCPGRFFPTSEMHRLFS